MIKRKIFRWKNILPYIVPFVANVALIVLLYFMLKVFDSDNERLLGDVFLISGGASLIFTFTFSIASSQLIEFILYSIYRIRKMFNKHYSKYNDPDSFRDFHEHISSDEFIFMLPAYVMSIIILTFGLVYSNLLL